jgi:hypothetical protein
MSNDFDIDLPVSHAITDGWGNFIKTVLSSIGGNERACARCLSLSRYVWTLAHAASDRGQV